MARYLFYNLHKADKKKLINETNIFNLIFQQRKSLTKIF